MVPFPGLCTSPLMKVLFSLDTEVHTIWFLRSGLEVIDGLNAYISNSDREAVL